MIPTPENIAKLKAKKHKKVHKKISNTFIESAIKKNSVTALKTIYYLAMAVETIPNLKEMDNDKLLTIKFDTKDMLQYVEATLPSIKKNIESMQETAITFYDEEKEVIRGRSLLPSYDFHYGKHTIEVKIFVEIAKMIINVKRNYSMIDTKQLMKMKSKHTLKMLPLLMRISQYSDYVGKRKTLTLAELKAFFDVKYKRITDIERRILKPIQEELSVHSKLNFIYETNFDYFEAGRPKAISITIDIVKNQPTLF